MTIHSHLRSLFPKPAEVVWDYLVYMKSCERWMSPEELDGVALLVDSGRYGGFQWDPNRPDVQPIVSRVQRMDYGRSIQFRTVCADVNIPANARLGFPFRFMTQTMRFTNFGAGCEMVHEFEFEPNGPVGWVTCRLLLIPHVKRGVIQSHRRLAELLNAV